MTWEEIRKLIQETRDLEEGKEPGPGYLSRVRYALLEYKDLLLQKEAE